MLAKISNSKTVDEKSKISKFRVRTVNSNSEVNDSCSNLPSKERNALMHQVSIDIVSQHKEAISDGRSSSQFGEADDEKIASSECRRHSSTKQCYRRDSKASSHSRLDNHHQRFRGENLEVAFDLSLCDNSSIATNSKKDHMASCNQSASHHADTYSPYYTTEALPMLTFYKQATVSNSNGGSRPTLDDLHCPDVSIIITNHV